MPCQVHEDFSAFAAKVHVELSETRIIYIAIKPSIRALVPDSSGAGGQCGAHSSHVRGG